MFPHPFVCCNAKRHQIVAASHAPDFFHLFQKFFHHSISQSMNQSANVRIFDSILFFAFPRFYTFEFIRLNGECLWNAMHHIWKFDAISSVKLSISALFLLVFFLGIQSSPFVCFSPFFVCVKIQYFITQRWNYHKKDLIFFTFNFSNSIALIIHFLHSFSLSILSNCFFFFLGLEWASAIWNFFIANLKNQPGKKIEFKIYLFFFVGIKRPTIRKRFIQKLKATESNW